MVCTNIGLVYRNITQQLFGAMRVHKYLCRDDHKRVEPPFFVTFRQIIESDNSNSTDR